MFFFAFAHTSRPPESSHLKIIFFTSGVVKTCFDAFPDHQNQVFQKLFFHVWGGLKRSLILPDHQNQVIKKLFFSPLEGLETCFDAFTDHQNQVLKKLFFIVWSGSKRFLMHFLTTRNMSFKNYFLRL